jgi:hypothetical protein
MWFKKNRDLHLGKQFIYFVKLIKYFSIYTYLYVKILIFTFLKELYSVFQYIKNFNDAKFRN